MATTNPFDITAPKDDESSVLTAGTTQTMAGATPLAQTPTSQFNPTPNLAPQTYTAQTSSVNAPTETMQGQLASIMSKDNPMMRMARTSATQQMAQRGLINSSMAAGAGTAAMLDKALPIAQQDATAYNNRALANQEAINQQNQFNVGQTNDIYKFGQGVATQYGLQTAAQANDMAKMQLQQQFNLQGMDKQAQLELDKMSVGQQYNLLNMAQQQGYNLQTLTAQQINELQRMDLAQRFNLQGLDKQAQLELDKMSVGQQYNLLNMATQQGYNLQTLSAQQINELQRMATAQGYNLQTLNVQQTFQERIAALEQSGMDFRQARELASKEAMFQLEQSGITNRFDQELALKDKQFNIEQYNLEKRQILDNEAQLQRLNLQLNANQQNIPTSFAASISNTTMAGVNAIMSDPNMSSDAKNTAINNLINYANAQISWAEKFYSVAIPRLSTTV